MQRRCLDEFYNGLLDVAEQYIEKVAYTDCLTGLYTTKLLQRDFAEIIKISSCKTISLAFIEIDQFRNFNTLYGHETGNNVLRDISDILLSCKSEDNKSYRWGGDEMLNLSSHSSLNINDIEEYLLNIKDDMEKSVSKQISLTVGVSIKTSDEQKDLKTMLREAESAVMLGKSQQGNRIIFSSDKSIQMYEKRKQMFRYSFYCEKCKAVGHFNSLKKKHHSDIFNCLDCGNELVVW